MSSRLTKVAQSLMCLADDVHQPDLAGHPARATVEVGCSSFLGLLSIGFWGIFSFECSVRGSQLGSPARPSERLLRAWVVVVCNGFAPTWIVWSLRLDTCH